MISKLDFIFTYFYSFVEHEPDQEFKKSSGKLDKDDPKQNSSTTMISKLEDLVEEVKKVATFREVENGFEM